MSPELEEEFAARLEMAVETIRAVEWILPKPPVMRRSNLGGIAQATAGVREQLGSPGIGIVHQRRKLCSRWLAEEPWIYTRRDTESGAGGWSEHGHLWWGDS